VFVSCCYFRGETRSNSSNIIQSVQVNRLKKCVIRPEHLHFVVSEKTLTDELQAESKDGENHPRQTEIVSAECESVPQSCAEMVQRLPCVGNETISIRRRRPPAVLSDFVRGLQ